MAHFGRAIRSKAEKEAALQVEEIADQIEAMRDRLRRCAQRNYRVSLHQNGNQLPLPLQNWLEEVLQEVAAFLEELWEGRLCPWKGEPFDAQLKLTVFPDQEHESDSLPCVRDITLAQQAEQRLRENEERFQSLSACSPVGIFLTDVEGRCTYTNPRCQAICGFSFEQSLGSGWLQSVHPEDREQLLTDWSAWTLSHTEYTKEFRIQTPEGIIREVHMRASPMLSPLGELMGHVGTVEDITNRKQAEEARAQVIREQAARQEAEAANRMKDEFLATLSHELRTPLNSVLGWARLLRTRSFDEATTARALETIERNAKSQAQMIEDILDVSRIIRGKLHLSLRPINLVPAIETAIEAMRPA